jgi:hypothetical protein
MKIEQNLAAYLQAPMSDFRGLSVDEALKRARLNNDSMIGLGHYGQNMRTEFLSRLFGAAGAPKTEPDKEPADEDDTTDEEFVPKKKKTKKKPAVDDQDDEDQPLQLPPGAVHAIAAMILRAGLIRRGEVPQTVRADISPLALGILNSGRKCRALPLLAAGQTTTPQTPSSPSSGTQIPKPGQLIAQAIAAQRGIK